jgi:hypothetical protein
MSIIMTVESDAQLWNQTAESYAKSPVSDKAGYERTLDRTRAFLQASDKVLEIEFHTSNGDVGRPWIVAQKK